MSKGEECGRKIRKTENPSTKEPDAALFMWYPMAGMQSDSRSKVGVCTSPGILSKHGVSLAAEVRCSVILPIKSFKVCDHWSSGRGAFWPTPSPLLSGSRP